MLRTRSEDGIIKYMCWYEVENIGRSRSHYNKQEGTWRLSTEINLSRRCFNLILRTKTNCKERIERGTTVVTIPGSAGDQPFVIKNHEEQTSELFRHEKITGFGYLLVGEDRVREQEESGWYIRRDGKGTPHGVWLVGRVCIVATVDLQDHGRGPAGRWGPAPEAQEKNLEWRLTW